MTTEITTTIEGLSMMLVELENGSTVGIEAHFTVGDIWIIFLLALILIVSIARYARAWRS